MKRFVRIAFVIFNLRECVSTMKNITMKMILVITSWKTKKQKYMSKKYFISFTEEFWQGQIPKIMGRIEVYKKSEEYAVEEIRFCTDNEELFYKFRERWDLETITEKELRLVRNIATMFEQEWLNKRKNAKILGVKND